jgi:hypothetical protein
MLKWLLRFSRFSQVRICKVRRLVDLFVSLQISQLLNKCTAKKTPAVFSNTLVERHSSFFPHTHRRLLHQRGKSWQLEKERRKLLFGTRSLQRANPFLSANRENVTSQFSQSSPCDSEMCGGRVMQMRAHAAAALTRTFHRSQE